MLKEFLMASALAAAFVGADSAIADSNIAIVPRIDTRGLGADIVVKATDKLNFRAGVKAFSFSRDDTASGIDYQMKAKLLSGGAYLDWHPSGKSFRVSVGGVINGNEVTAVNKPAQSFNVGAHTYLASEIGELNGTLKTNKFAPYLGIGWGNAVSGDKRVKLLFDLGVMYHGTPDATLEANLPTDSPLRSNPVLHDQFMADLEQERSDFQDDANSYKFYPVISVGLAIRF